MNMMNTSAATSNVELVSQLAAGTSIPESFFFSTYIMKPTHTYKNKKFVERKLRKMGR